MKTNLKSTLMLTAAVMTLGAAAANGQDAIEANVPFSFHTIAGKQPAGPYVIRPVGLSNNVVAIRNMDTLNATMLGIGVPEGDSTNSRPRLVFRCGDVTGCALSAVWMDGTHGLKYRTPHLKPSELERVAVVYLDRKANQ